jgi:hypothetical protein
VIVGSKSLNPQRAKIHRNYTIDEIARLFGVHRNTVRNWQKSGLQPIDSGRPILVTGHALAEFLTKRRADARKPCSAGELFCMKCRAPRRPAAGMVEFTPMTPTNGNLVGICPACHSLMNRRIRKDKLEAFMSNLEGTPTHAKSHLNQ